jgi:Amt family ammonium transporter
MVPQLIATVVAGAYGFIGTFILLKIIDRVMGLRVSPEQEDAGLDLSIHGESAGYRLVTITHTVSHTNVAASEPVGHR